MLQRSQTKATLQSRLLVQAMRLKDEANALPDGPLRDAAIRKARQAETASHPATAHTRRSSPQVPTTACRRR
jgi:hypothetical protein